MDNKVIDKFRDEYAFLSNFYECEISYEGLVYRNAEAAFQSAKCLDISDRLPFINLTAVEARARGKKVPLRSDWNEVRDDIMYEIVKNKFYTNDYISQKLVTTIDYNLVESNTWGDTYWGVCNGVGKNRLGEILMKVREGLIINA